MTAKGSRGARRVCDQRIRHDEIAVDGSLAARARQEGLDDDPRVLLTILDAHGVADGRLSELAKRTVNRGAA